MKSSNVTRTAVPLVAGTAGFLLGYEYLGVNCSYLMVPPGCSNAQGWLFPFAGDYPLGPDEYLEQIHRIKAAVKVPVIASLNGVTGEGWTGYARLIEQAGADALELNMYVVAVNPIESGGSIERRLIDVTESVRSSVALPIAVKLSPFWSSVSHVAASLDGAGADGLVLFNRFYQPDIDIEELDVVPRLRLSDPSELLLRIR